MILSRYGSFDIISRLDFETGRLLIQKALEEKRKEIAFELYKTVFPYMDKDSFISFDEFYNAGTPEKGAKTEAEILKETERILKTTVWKE